MPIESLQTGRWDDNHDLVASEKIWVVFLSHRLVSESTASLYERSVEVYRRANQKTKIPFNDYWLNIFSIK